MFNSITHKHIRNEAVPYAKTVTEVRAPTDASIALYREMVEKARQEVVRNFAVDTDNLVKFKGVVMANTGHLDSEVFVYSLTINGKEYRGEIPTERAYGGSASEMRTQINTIMEKLADKIAASIVQGWANEIINAVAK